MAFDMNAAHRSVRRKYDTYRQLVGGVGSGRLRHLIVRGRQGLGKTHEAEEVLRPMALSGAIRYHRSAGHATPVAVYTDLYNLRRRNDVLLFDDCDAVFTDKQAMNILKAATDTKLTRTISWGTSSTRVPSQEFVYEGRVIIITNADFRGERYQPFLDRVFFLDLSLSPEEVLARVLEVIYQQTQFREQRDEVAVWLIDNLPRFGEKLSIRSAMKCLELATFSPGDWQGLAEQTIVQER